MGCSQSKERQSDEAVNENVSPVRDETLRPPPPEEEVVGSEVDDQKISGHKFVQGGPSVSGGLLTPCFKAGVLFKVSKDDVMYFYNDSAEHEAVITFECGPQSTIVPAENVKQVPLDSWTKLTLTVYPGETEKFITGTLNGYRSEYVVKPLTSEYIERINQEAEALVQQELEKITSLGLSDVDRVAEECCRAKLPFVDTSFPPHKRSLSRPSDARQLHPLVWKRPRTFLPDGSQGSLFKDGVHPDDIDQGQLGDCWFLCSVASVAEFPAKIQDIFSHPRGDQVAQDERAVGIYRVTLNKNGWWQCVVVDDFLPCIINKPCFAKNDGDYGELWVSLLEKAYAKINGSYAAITGGDALHAMSDLTGYPTTRFDTEWEEARASEEGSQLLFDDLLRYDTEGYLINLNTPGADTSAYMGAGASSNEHDLEAKYKEAGLGLGHAYSVLVVKEFDVDGTRHRLLKIRNPWGSGAEWTGRWSDSSVLWTDHPLIAQECGHTDANDGTFWMDWEDVKVFFDGGGVCFTKFNWHDYRVRGAFHEGAPDMALEIFAHEDIDAFIVLSQPDRRGQPDTSVNSKYSPLMLSVCEADPANSVRQLVCANSTSDADKPTKPFTYIIARDVGVKYHFKKSDHPYVIVPRIHDKGVDKQFVLGLITSKAVGPSMTVNFKQLPAGSPGLKHCKAFPYMHTDVPHAPARDFQYNAEVGCPVTMAGTGLQTPEN